jgi:hypothetical protein
MGLGFFGVSANADELSVLLNGKAIHLDEQSDVHYNENNWGAGFQYDMAPIEETLVPFVTFSGFKDSNKNTSYYGGGGLLHRVKFEWGKTPMHFDAGAIVFLMKRKGFHDGDLFPGILPAFFAGHAAGRGQHDFYSQDRSQDGAATVLPAQDHARGYSEIIL